MDKLEQLTQKDLEEFYQLYLYAFTNLDSKGRRTFFDHRYNHALKYGIKHNGKLRSGMLSIPFHVNFHGVKYKMNGIGDVMSYPEYGGNGAITQLMQQAFNDMLEDNVALSYLAPFSYDFYRRFGYEEVFDRTIYRVKNTDLPRVKIDKKIGSIERLTLAEAIPFIKEVYANNPNSHNAGLIREDWWWDYLVLKHPHWQVGVYFSEDHLSAGYVIYEGLDTTFSIQEIMFTNWESFQYLSRFICQHESMFSTFEYASGDPLGHPDILKNPSNVEVQIKPYMMARIINLETFINHYPFLKKIKSTRVAVTDKMLPANNGIWRLLINANGTSFEKISDNENNMADIRISIQELTKVLLGYRSLNELNRIGAIRGSYEAITNLDATLRKEPPMLWDYF
ncbi:GNAT family N-acetyltransferase [Pediococcus pentosaceus]|uniref:GNAT family N-acetyltransferase n=1 Tax=Pediococcus pentosaceus TaxID=1255 RepID=UPI00403985E0